MPLGAAVGILVGVVAVGLVLVFTVGHTTSGTSSLVAQPGATATAQVTGSASARASAGASTTAPGTAAGSGTTTVQPTGTSTGDGAGDGTGSGGGDGGSTGGAGGTSPEFYVGECVNTSGSGSRFSVDQASCSGAQYKIIYAYQNETGNVVDDQSQCYSINGNDDEFENGDTASGYTLYCMNSLTGDYSPRRASVNNCLDSKGAYEVDCTSSRAAWIVIGRIDGTTNTKNCARYGSYDYSYYYTAAPQFVLCVNKYHH